MRDLCNADKPLFAVLTKLTIPNFLLRSVFYGSVTCLLNTSPSPGEQVRSRMTSYG